MRVIKVGYEGRVVGEIIGDIYVTVRNTKQHFCRACQGYPITKKVLGFLASKQVKKIRVKEIGKQVKWYEADLMQYLHGKEYKLGEFEPQLGIPIKEMVLVKDGKGNR
jgi:hypothetical protein